MSMGVSAVASWLVAGYVVYRAGAGDAGRAGRGARGAGRGAGGRGGAVALKNSAGSRARYL